MGPGTRWMLMLAVLALAGFVAAGCGGSTQGESGGAGTQADGGDGGDGGGELKVGLVTDQGGLNDRSFNALANEGLMRAEQELGIQGDVLESKSPSDYEVNLARFAQEGYDLVIGVGFLMAEPLQKVAKQFPQTNFAIVDYSYGDAPMENVRGLVFKEHEAGYLAGALAGLVEADGKLKGLNGDHVVGTVGGQSIPPVNKFMAGYQAGVMSTCEDCRVLIAYSQDFLAQDKCKEQALSQIADGADIIFQVAGGCGLGALDAAKGKGVWGIGVDADQSDLGPHILTSAVKKVDVAVFDVIQSVQSGSFAGGEDGIYGVAEDGVGLGTISPAASQYQARIEEITAEVKAGSVEIPEEVKT